jgi:hypothetical protein
MFDLSANNLAYSIFSRHYPVKQVHSTGLLDLTAEAASTPCIGLFDLSARKLAGFIFPRHYPVKQVHDIGLLDVTVKPGCTPCIGLFDISENKLDYFIFPQNYPVKQAHDRQVKCILPQNMLVHHVLACLILLRKQTIHISMLRCCHRFLN